jgi:hypothetical protein
MTWIPSIQTGSITLCNPQQEPVVSLSLGTNNDKPIGSRIARLLLKWHEDYPAEIEIEPGERYTGDGRGNDIISQVVIWGAPTADGTGRQRLTASMTGNGGAVIDSTTNDPSGSEGQRRAAPLVFNAGEGKGMYVALYPSDNTIDFQDRVAGISTGRIPFAALIAKLLRP